MDKKKPGGDCDNPTDTVEANFCLLNEPIIGESRIHFVEFLRRLIIMRFEYDKYVVLPQVFST